MKEETKSNEKIEVTHIEIVWEDSEDLVELSTTELFSNFILEKTYKSIQKAIDENLESIELFNVFNLSIIVELNRPDFKSVLEKIKNLYVTQEDYEECNKIMNLIKKI
jgi:hypothetical protein